MHEYVFKPLGDWPDLRTPEDARRVQPFRTGGKQVNSAWVADKPIPVDRTYADLERELRHLRAADPVELHVGLRPSHIRADGRIRADAPQPAFPGVILQFAATIADRTAPMSFACDDCTRWQDNLRAIVLTLERLRLADLYGVTKRGQQYRGWQPQLPGPIVTPPKLSPGQAAARLARLSDEAATPDDLLGSSAVYRVCYRDAAARLHPDGTAPDAAAWAELQDAKAALDAHHAGRG